MLRLPELPGTVTAMAGDVDSAPGRINRKGGKIALSVQSACIEFTRDLFMEVMRDGALSDTERHLLQCGVALMSQVVEKFGNSRERISMPAQGPVSNVVESFPASENFMEGVARDIDAHFSRVRAEGMRKTKEEDHSAGAELGRLWMRRLAKVTGTDHKVEGSQLLACCHVPSEFDSANEFGSVLGYVLTSLSQITTNSYLFKDRLVDVYKAARGKMRGGFLKATTRFLLTCLVYACLNAWLGMVAVVLQIRVFLCFGSRLPLLGSLVVYPISSVAEKVFDWQHDHWLLGCMEMDEQQSSLISMVPVLLNRHVLTVLLCRPEIIVACFAILVYGWLPRSWALQLKSQYEWYLVITALVLIALVVHVLELWFEKLPSAALETLFGEAHVQFGIEFLLDFLFTTLLCSLDRNVVAVAGDVIQPKLVLISVKLGTLAQVCW